jgi:hypothetical protein
MWQTDRLGRHILWKTMDIFRTCLNMLKYSLIIQTWALSNGLSDVTNMLDRWMHRQPCSKHVQVLLCCTFCVHPRSSPQLGSFIQSWNCQNNGYFHVRICTCEKPSNLDYEWLQTTTWRLGAEHRSLERGTKAVALELATHAPQLATSTWVSSWQVLLMPAEWMSMPFSFRWQQTKFPFTMV